MVDTQEIQRRATSFPQVLDAAAKLPGVRIDRATYLRAALRRHCDAEQIERAVADTPAAAGVPLTTITAVANGSITTKQAR
ncbi:hypothetical protein [Ruania zhangjianzhongii]|uniref:hypothetical protein n=1 Tax=Ruania zhangjianzhongii TaxID=2603206 RepID=UPI001AEFEF4C|nr:hypothetical protein [Ruania zhangjianzhongii]